MKHIRLFENFDRYDFGIIENDNEIRTFFSSVGFVDFTNVEIIEMKNTLPVSYSLIKTSRKAYSIWGTTSDICINALGDYCYSISIGNFTEDGFVYERLYIIDDFDDLCDKITEILKNT